MRFEDMIPPAPVLLALAILGGVVLLMSTSPVFG